VRSIDGGRERPVSRDYEGYLPNGQLVRQGFDVRTLVVAVKANCHGCASLLGASREDFGAVSVLVIAASAIDEPQWRQSSLDRLISPSLFEALDIRFPPLWVLVDGERGLVLCEGVPFGPRQIAEEIADLL